MEDKQMPLSMERDGKPKKIVIVPDAHIDRYNKIVDENIEAREEFAVLSLEDISSQLVDNDYYSKAACKAGGTFILSIRAWMHQYSGPLSTHDGTVLKLFVHGMLVLRTNSTKNDSYQCSEERKTWLRFIAVASENCTNFRGPRKSANIDTITNLLAMYIREFMFAELEYCEYYSSPTTVERIHLPGYYDIRNDIVKKHINRQKSEYSVLRNIMKDHKEVEAQKLANIAKLNSESSDTIFQLPEFKPRSPPPKATAAYTPHKRAGKGKERKTNDQLFAEIKTRKEYSRRVVHKGVSISETTVRIPISASASESANIKQLAKQLLAEEGSSKRRKKATVSKEPKEAFVALSGATAAMYLHHQRLQNNNTSSDNQRNQFHGMTSAKVSSSDSNHNDSSRKRKHDDQDSSSDCDDIGTKTWDNIKRCQAVAAGKQDEDFYGDGDSDSDTDEEIRNYNGAL